MLIDYIRLARYRLAATSLATTVSVIRRLLSRRDKRDLVVIGKYSLFASILFDQIIMKIFRPPGYTGLKPYNAVQWWDEVES